MSNVNKKKKEYPDRCAQRTFEKIGNRRKTKIKQIKINENRNK